MSASLRLSGPKPNATRNFNSTERRSKIYAACSGLWYDDPGAAGDIAAIKLDGVIYGKPDEVVIAEIRVRFEKPTQALCRHWVAPAAHAPSQFLRRNRGQNP